MLGSGIIIRRHYNKCARILMDGMVMPTHREGMLGSGIIIRAHIIIHKQEGARHYNSQGSEGTSRSGIIIHGHYNRSATGGSRHYNGRADVEGATL
jgi:hypothetical protein